MSLRGAKAWLALATALALASATADAWQTTGPLPQAWRNWHYSRAVNIVGATKARLVSVVVPPEVHIQAQPRLEDLRVMDDAGTEVPYILYAPVESTSMRVRTALMKENSFVPGQFTQVVVALAGDKAEFHNAVSVETPEPDFITWIEVAVSDDARTWRIIADRAPIFRFRKQEREGNRTVSYPETTAHYVRLRIFEGAKQFPVAGAEVIYQVTQQAEVVPASAPLTPERSTKPGRSAWSADLGASLPTVAAVRFEVEQPEFNRAAEVSSSADGRDWNRAATTEIYRFRRDNKVQEHLNVSVTEGQPARYWRVEVANGNDAPLVGARAALYVTPRRVLFRQQPRKSYRLLYGQSRAKPPKYEIAQLTSRKEIDAAASGRLGPEEANTAYADPRPWTERNDLLLWVALGLMVTTLGASALRALRKRA